MSENPDITAAKEAYMKLTDEQDRLTFIDWCRRENDKALFRTIDFAESEALHEIRQGIRTGFEKLNEVGENVKKAVDKAPDVIKKTSSSLDDLMSRIIKGEKKS